MIKLPISKGMKWQQENSHHHYEKLELNEEN